MLPPENQLWRYPSWSGTGIIMLSGGEKPLLSMLVHGRRRSSYLLGFPCSAWTVAFITTDGRGGPVRTTTRPPNDSTAGNIEAPVVTTLTQRGDYLFGLSVGNLLSQVYYGFMKVSTRRTVGSRDFQETAEL